MKFPTWARIAALSLIAMFMTVDLAAPASAADARDFDPGYIISDAEFYDANSMTAAQIQAFLESKVSRCEVEKSYGPHDPIVCLKDYRMNTVTIPADAYCTGTYAGASNELASTIIYKVAQACGINPKVLLVTLQKEQGLVTHTWPSSYRYDKAMGFACPDTAPCDTQYFGFQNQVWRAARQFQRYKAHPSNYNYRAGMINTIYYYPPNQRPQCGASSVYIKNVATASLYNYTPYQPNQAALSNLYGTGNECSSYGNRNFWRDYTDWFGNPTVDMSFSTIAGGAYVLALTSAGELYGYPTTGKSGWGKSLRVATGLGSSRFVFGAGDLTRGGVRDVIVVDNAGKVWTYVGEQNLRDRIDAGVDLSGAKWAGYAGDFTGDGLLDIFSIGSDGKLAVWPGRGDGTFAARQVLSGSWSTHSLLVGPGDFDGDGRADLIGRLPNGDLMLYKGSGAGTFAEPLRIGIGWNSITALIAAGDFNGDGMQDLLGRTSAGDLVLYRGTGGGMISGMISRAGTVGIGWGAFTIITGAGDPDGLFQPQQPESSPEPTPDPTPSQSPPPSNGGGNPGGVTGDFTGDGKPDVAAVKVGGVLSIYAGAGTSVGSTATRASADTFNATDRLVRLGDFNGDGIDDIGRVDSGGVFRLYPGRGDSTVGPGVQIGHGWGAFTAIFSLDFDGDGSRDVMARNTKGDLMLYRGNGKGGWATGRGEQVGVRWETFTAIFSPGDFDGDGLDDVIARAPDGVLYLYPTDGKGGWKPRLRVGTRWHVFSEIAGVGDFDGDGRNDVIARFSDGRLYLYRGNGSAGWLGSSLLGSAWADATLVV